MLRAIHADITTLAVDAIVNAANGSLLGGGVDAPSTARRRNCCRCRSSRLATARELTRCYRLPASSSSPRGPVWRGGVHCESGCGRLLPPQPRAGERTRGWPASPFLHHHRVYGYPLAAPRSRGRHCRQAGTCRRHRGHFRAFRRTRCDLRSFVGNHARAQENARPPRRDGETPCWNRPGCECCDATCRPMPVAPDLFLRCPFCSSCVTPLLGGRCPNSAALHARGLPGRRRAARHPASATRVHKPRAAR